MKKLYSQITIILLSLLFMADASAEVSVQHQKQINRLKREALSAFTHQNYNKALKLYLKLDSLTENKKEYDYMLGMCYLSSKEKSKALPYLESAKEKGQTSFVVYYYLGRAYLLSNRNDDALAAFQIYADNLTALKDFKFSKPRVINESNRVHMEKTLDDVKLFISMCDVSRKDFSGLALNTK